jgi:hypothetical protein
VPLICWVAVTKLLIKQSGEAEDAEKATDYLAMHVYKNDNPGEKLLNGGHPLIKSTYTNEQTVMLYMQNLDRNAVLEQRQALCLVLDQLKRKKDLFYKVEVSSSHDFASQRLGKKYAHKQVIEVPTMPVSGGPPSSPFFFKNPQFVVCLDTSQIIDKQAAITAQN